MTSATVRVLLLLVRLESPQRIITNSKAKNTITATHEMTVAIMLGHSRHRVRSDTKVPYVQLVLTITSSDLTDVWNVQA